MPGVERTANLPSKRYSLFRPVAAGCLCILILLTSCSRPHEQGIIYRNGEPLSYKKDQFGNRIPDYSTAGYGGGKAIPSVPVTQTLVPGNMLEDDTERIQQAIDTISQRTPDSKGIRGALLLKAGQYQVAGQIRITASGVILRGEGQFENGTVIRATGTQRRSLIILHGKDPDQDAANRAHPDGRFQYRNANSHYWEIMDEYVPSGRDYVQVAPLKGLNAGDTVILEQRMNQEWVDTLGMSEFPPRSDGKPSKPWDPLDFVFHFERTITRIDGGRVHLNAPLVNPIFADFGINRLFVPELPHRITQSGVEDLRLVSDFRKTDKNSDEAHAWTGVEINRARDCWVRGVSTQYFGRAAVSTESEALFITVEDCAYLAPMARVGYGRRHGFLNAGQQVLYQRCLAENSLYPFMVAERTPGPNVFLDCYASGEKVVIGPWRYWSMGTLWDRVYGQHLMIRNRGYDGLGWGWSGINHLFWNCSAFEWISVQSPVNGWNWAIGCKGRRMGAPFQGLIGHFSNHGNRVQPDSLYAKQLEDRLRSSYMEDIFSASQLSGTVLFHVRDTLAE